MFLHSFQMNETCAINCEFSTRCPRSTFYLTISLEVVQCINNQVYAREGNLFGLLAGRWAGPPERVVSIPPAAGRVGLRLLMPAFYRVVSGYFFLEKFLLVKFFFWGKLMTKVWPENMKHPFLAILIDLLSIYSKIGRIHIFSEELRIMKRKTVRVMSGCNLRSPVIRPGLVG